MGSGTTLPKGTHLQDRFLTESATCNRCGFFLIHPENMYLMSCILVLLLLYIGTSGPVYGFLRGLFYINIHGFSALKTLKDLKKIQIRATLPLIDDHIILLCFLFCEHYAKL